MVEAVDVIQVATRLRNLAADVENQPYMARRGVLPSLKQFLSHPQEEVRLLGLDTLRFLASHPNNRDLMTKEPGLVESLVICFNSYPTTASTKVPMVISDILTYLSPFFTEEQKQNCTLSLAQVMQLQKSKGDDSVQDAEGVTSQPLIDALRTLTLDIESLTTEKAREDLEAVLLKTRGTISYTMHHQYMTLYTRTPTATILKILQEKGYSAKLRSEKIEETSTTTLSSEQPVKKAQYLPSPEREKDSAYKRSLTTVGANSLQDRLKKKKSTAAPTAQTDNKSDTGVSRFLNKITSVFW